ncbi:MAG: hypothetical protein AUG51_10185 [Acidobacteria bacterium 13_1_20CM_3_53_8]|nr:MAG: hypothetical protein AUG51_10185 [Acidobacteria bacterium 13_1_20CM_3_53_8]
MEAFMNSKHKKVTSAIALVLAVALSQVYVHANLPDASGNTKSPSNASAPFGKLTANYSNPTINSMVGVNDVAVESGATIFSGSRINTPEDVGAKIELGALGQVDIAPGSSLTLNFTTSNVAVNLDQGYATLTTNLGINGTLTTSAGAVEHTDITKRSSVDATAGAAQGGGGTTGGGTGGGVPGADSARTFGLIVWGSAVVLAFVFIPCRGGHPGNVSPHTAGEDCHHHP